MGCFWSPSIRRSSQTKQLTTRTAQAHHTLKDHRGHEVKFEDQPEVPQQEDIVLRLWRRLPETPLPNLYWLGGLFTAFWAYRMWGAFNRLMVIRYADINYQLRRPDVLANKAAERLGDEPILQFTAEACSCCHDLDDFIQDNDYVYVLFYSPKGRLNIDISAKFEQLAREWKWSRIHFGRIDVDKDRDMSKRWVDSNMVPTNVMYKFGRPVEDFEVIRDKYQGNPDGQKWMLTKYMGEDAEGQQELNTGGGVAIIGYFKKEGDREHKVYLEAIWKLFQGDDVDKDDIGAGVGYVIAPNILKQVSVTAPSLVLYLDGKAISLEGRKQLERWSESAPLSSYLRAQAMAMKESFQQPCGEAHRTIHETVDPVASDLQQGPLATFARRSQTVGLLNIPKPDELILPRS
eukprot:g16436.t1